MPVGPKALMAPDMWVEGGRDWHHLQGCLDQNPWDRSGARDPWHLGTQESRCQVCPTDTEEKREDI